MDVYDLQEYHIPQKKQNLKQKRIFMWTKRSFSNPHVDHPGGMDGLIFTSRGG